MRAIVQPRYGGPESVELADVPKPGVGDGEVLVQVRSSSVNAADVETLDGFGLVRMASPLRPAARIAGSDIAGVVEEVGAGVTDLVPGDEVMGDTSEHGYGAFAEYAVAPAEAVCRLPRGLALEDAGSVPSAAWVAIKAARGLGAGDRLLINGAGGSMGTFLVQMAKARGAHVTGVDGADKLDLIGSLGADETVDFRTTDASVGEGRYELIIDVYARRPLRDWRRILSPTGSYRMVGGSSFRVLAGFAQGWWLSRGGEQQLGVLLGWPQTREDMDETNALIASGQVRPVIGHRFPLERTAEALRLLKDGRSMGKIAIDIERHA